MDSEKIIKKTLNSGWESFWMKREGRTLCARYIRRKARQEIKSNRGE